MALADEDQGGYTAFDTNAELQVSLDELSDEFPLRLTTGKPVGVRSDHGLKCFRQAILENRHARDCAVPVCASLQ